MKSKKSKKSYADLAKAIIGKYKKRLGDDLSRYDKLATESLNRELSALMAEQEAYKQAELEKEYQQMCKGGKLRKMWSGGELPMMWDGGIFSNDPDDDPYLDKYMKSIGRPPIPRFKFYADGFNNTTGIPVGNTSTVPESFTIKPGSTKSTIIGPGNTITPQGITTVQQQVSNSTDNKSPKQSWWSSIPTESKVGAITQLAGVLGQGVLAATAGKPKDMTYNPVTLAEPELIRNDEQLNQATRAFRGAQNNLRYLSPSQYMAAMNDLATREAGARAGIVENTANKNAEILNRDRMVRAEIARQNEEMRLGVDQYNEAARQGYIANIGSMIGDVGNYIAGGARDALAYKQWERGLGYTGSANRETVRLADNYLANVMWAKPGIAGHYMRDGVKHYLIDGEDLTGPEAKKRFDELTKKKD